MPAAFSALRLDKMARSFGAHNALKGLDLEIRKGEFIALLGPSGCGKSTALNCIAGLLALTGGRILLDEKRIDELPPEKRGFGMVFQSYALFPHLSVRDNIGFGLKMRGLGRSERAPKVEDALNLVRLGGQGDKLPGQLSGGQQQRVAIARAIVIEPPLVLMDEPLSNLDAKLRLEMRQEIRRIHQTLGATTIYVTHDQEEALSLADRIVVLNDGVIRQVGTPAELYGAPEHLDVADFMGFRNRIAATRPGGAGPASAGETVAFNVGGAGLMGIAREAIAGTRVTAAIRPEDLQPGPGELGVPARVTAVEYRGATFYGVAEAAGAGELHFSSVKPVQVGETIPLVAHPDRVVVFADERA